MHIKICDAAGWNFGEPLTVPFKLSSRGLVGADRRAFVKRAGFNIFEDQLRDIKIAKDEYPAHAIAVGAHEFWGFNRNGDGFPEKACQDYAHTFVKFGAPYRSHQNKPEKGHPTYGTIKLAAYNPLMRRIELLVAFNAEKTAAERNKGFLADMEIEKLARGDDLPGSMAARVPYDECVYCHNKAASRDDYCTGATCAAGGCKDHLTDIVKLGNDVIHMGVLNPHPGFFDWSTVFRPAERTGYSTHADWYSQAS
jgi:hypothetical protein